MMQKMWREVIEEIQKTSGVWCPRMGKFKQAIKEDRNCESGVELIKEKKMPANLRIDLGVRMYIFFMYQYRYFENAIPCSATVSDGIALHGLMRCHAMSCHVLPHPTV